MATWICMTSIKSKSVMGSIHVMYRQIVTYTYNFHYIKNVLDQPLWKTLKRFLTISIQPAVRFCLPKV